MPRKATGEVRQNAGGTFSTRIRTSEKERTTFDLTHARTKDQAEERSAILADLARRFMQAPTVSSRDAIETMKMAAGASEKTLRTVLALAEELLGGQLIDDNGDGTPTFSEVVDKWADGSLAKAYPHQIKMPGSDHLDAAKARVEKDCFTPIRDVPVNLITRAMCDEVMRSLPLPAGKTEISPSTRRHYGVLINRTLNLAELAGYIERSPIPKGWLPSPGARKRFPILYPSEDKQLLKCKAVPIEWRVFYAFLHREGVRREEAASLQIKDIDFEHETVSLDENKTNHPRFWRLSPGVASALEKWIARRIPDEPDADGPDPEELVFVDENGGPLRMDHMAERVRRHLDLAQVKRPDLTSTGKNKGAFGTHSFRRSFVTRSLALGKPEDWVRQRTGHTTDELLRYRQGAKALAELELSDLDPMEEVIPGLSLPRDCPVIRRGGEIRTHDPLSPRQVR